MVLTSGTTAWRDGPIMPANYDNLSDLVMLGRGRGGCRHVRLAVQRSRVARPAEAVYE